MPTELRHVYRALLRAATYLPDSASRTYIHDRVVNRFRAVSDKIRLKKGAARETLIARYHGKEHIRKAQQQARKIERAGLGSLSDYRKILLATYGRIGSRRRALIRELLLPEEDSSSDTESLEQFITERAGEGRSEPAAMKDQRYPPDSKVGSFIRSQVAEAPNPPFMASRLVKRLEPIIPREGMWGRPLPLKRQASLKKKHWKLNLSNLLPPVPAHEWNRLRDLAIGALPIEDRPLRRPRPIIVGRLDGEQNNARLLNYFTTPVDQQRMRQQANNEITISEEGATYLSKPRVAAVVPKRQEYAHTVRHMRRLYASIWQLTPTLSRNEATNGWNTKWGIGRSAFLSGEITAPKARDMELFEGAKKPEEPQQKRPKRGKKVKKAAKRDLIRRPFDRQEVAYRQGVIAST